VLTLSHSRLDWLRWRLAAMPTSARAEPPHVEAPFCGIYPLCRVCVRNTALPITNDTSRSTGAERDGSNCGHNLSDVFFLASTAVPNNARRPRPVAPVRLPPSRFLLPSLRRPAAWRRPAPTRRRSLPYHAGCCNGVGAVYQGRQSSDSEGPEAGRGSIPPRHYWYCRCYLWALLATWPS